MKTMKLIYPLALALVVTLAATGCKHTPTKITQIPSSDTGNPRDINPNPTLPPGPPINPEPNPQPTVIATAEGWRVEDMIQDRAALAAYTVHFAYDSAAIRNSEQVNLQSVAQALSADASTKLLIEGNCDERGTEEYNRSLGERRALAAREALAKMGIDPMRVRTISYGKDKPADPGHDESAWKQNRRDEFVLLHPKTGA
ncbi:MAG TPA: OmpA family protein [Verrucomicrobiae bacterium]|jgi:peptidoglycan-associated lipoprotein